MFRLCLVLLIVSNIQSARATSYQERLERFAYSPAWLKTLSYKKSFWNSKSYNSKASEDKFFVSKKGRNNPLEELKQSIRFINLEKKLGHINKPFACAFPYRRKLIAKNFPEIKLKKINCSELNDWLKALAAEELYLIYAGPYPQNPASMFGHTFLRLRGKRSTLLDYVVGFQAAVNPSDDPISYTLKGFMGGYVGFYDLKPYYIDVGIYNNMESRSLWEYKIKMDKEKVKDLQLHLWELLNNTGFTYYFLDENCSYYLLTLFEVIYPDKTFTDLDGTLVYPIETVKKLSSILELEKPIYRAPIKDKITYRYENLKKEKRKKFLEIYDDKKGIKETKDPFVLDIINDYWKYENYKEKTNLSEREKSIMNFALKARAKLIQDSEDLELKSKKDPQDIHKTGKLTVSTGLIKDKGAAELMLNSGYHGKLDSEKGILIKSFIDFFGIKLRYTNNELSIPEYTLVNIMALDDFNLLFKGISWHVKFYGSEDCILCNGRYKFVGEGMLGLSKIGEDSSFWVLGGLNSTSNDKSQLFSPAIKFGSKYDLKNNLSFLIDGFYLSRNSKVEGTVSGGVTWGIKKNFNVAATTSYRNFDNDNRSFISMRLNF